jgi:microcystin-dependent protein
MSDVFGGQESAALESASGSERPLTDEERALLQRLLSDPFSIPQQFKTWMVSYLEGSDMLLARSSVQGLTDLLGSGGGSGILGLLPAGIIFPFGGAAEPTGAKLCNGQLLSRAGFKRLFDVIGTIYGAGDGSTTFAVPDLRRRVPYGAGVSTPHGGSDGKAEASRSIDHHHHLTDTKGLSISGVGDHSHTLGLNLVKAINAADSDLAYTVPTGQGTNPSGSGSSGAGGHSHGGSVTIDADTTGGFENNHPSFLTVGFIINY